MEQTYRLTGMRCPACAAKIEAGLRPFAETVAVDFPSATVRLVNPTLPLPDLQQRVAAVGAYTLRPTETPVAVSDAEGPVAYYPLLLIGAYLTVGSFAGVQSTAQWMMHFMAGFFLVFSFFKLLNLRAFAEGYASYDLIAGRWRFYGFVYPFIELALGVAYLFGWETTPALWATLTVTIISGIGVVRSLRRGQALRCACLGTQLNVPLSTVTLIEDFGMAAMALIMLGLA